MGAVSENIPAEIFEAMRDAFFSRCRASSSTVRVGSPVARTGIYLADVAHAGESVSLAKEKIKKAVDHAYYRKYSGVKVIHGYGSKSGISIISGPAIGLMGRLARQYGGALKRDWANRGASLILFR